MTNATLTPAQEIEREINITKDLGMSKDIGESDVLIQVMPNPQRQKYMLWSMEDGLPIAVPRYRIEDMLRKVDADGNPRFTSHKERAPEPVVGTYRCFLAADSEERLSGELAKAGVTGAATCKYRSGPSEWAKAEHQRIKHKQSSRMWDAYQAKKRDDEWRQEQREMQAAQRAMMMAFATQGAPAPVAMPALPATDWMPMTCECGWTTKPDSKNPTASMNTHKRLHCKLGK